MDPNDLPKYVGSEVISQFIRDMMPVTEDVSSPVVAHCRRDDVPILSDDARALIAFLMKLKTPKRVLEIGTAYGASALFMSQFLAPEGHVDTIERNPVMLVQAREYLKTLGGGKITLHEGHAQEILPELSGPYDMVLMDASMGQYGIFWEQLQRLTQPGSYIFADNVLHGGMAAMDRMEIPRRQRTIHARLHEYIETVMHDTRCQSALLPVGDGVLLSYRK